MEKRLLTGAAFAATFIASAAMGQTWVEAGDAGDLPGSAQVPMGSGPLTMIEGTYANPTDADMYLIHIDDPAGFEATTANLSQNDTQLFLFDANGFGVTHNDDDPTGIGGLRSRITGVFVPAPGDYYIATSQYNTDPVSASGPIWANSPFGEERQPDGPGAADPVIGWESAFGSDGGYGIAMRGVSYPGPAGPSLMIEGSCPGEITVIVNGASANGFVAFIYAFGEGNQQIPMGFPCAGTELGLNATAVHAGNAQADGSGVATFSGRVPAGACNRTFVQAVDIMSCGTTNVEAL